MYTFHIRIFLFQKGNNSNENVLLTEFYQKKTDLSLIYDN